MYFGPIISENMKLKYWVVIGKWPCICSAAAAAGYLPKKFFRFYLRTKPYYVLFVTVYFSSMFVPLSQSSFVLLSMDPKRINRPIWTNKWNTHGTCLLSKINTFFTFNINGPNSNDNLRNWFVSIKDMSIIHSIPADKSVFFQKADQIQFFVVRFFWIVFWWQTKCKLLPYLAFFYCSNGLNHLRICF